MGFINRLVLIKIYYYMLWVLLIISIVEGIFVVLWVCKYFSSGRLHQSIHFSTSLSL